MRELMKHPPLGMLSPLSTGTPRRKTLLIMRGIREAHGKQDGIDKYNLTLYRQKLAQRSDKDLEKFEGDTKERTRAILWESHEQRRRSTEEEEK